MRLRLAASCTKLIASSASLPGDHVARRCGVVTVERGTADKPARISAGDIRATRISCERARTVARACLRDTLHGWRVQADLENSARVLLVRGAARVSFVPAGGGRACFV